MKTVQSSVLALLIFLSSCGSKREGLLDNFPNAQVVINDEVGYNDFDFLAGRSWSVHNRFLNNRLSNSSEWSEFEMVLSDYTTILGGYGNVDQVEGERNGISFEASSIRVFNKATEEWDIYWVDNITTKLIHQVTGKFDDGTGTFYGQELFNGRMTKLRFIWKDIKTNSAHWEQAYYDSTRNEWETNWIMKFTAIDKNSKHP